MDCQNGFWCLQLSDLINTLVLVATVAAIYLGHIRAVTITRDNDERREKRRREIEILFNLMRTRRAILDTLRVMALNLIEAEFFGNTKIIEAYRAYIVNLEKYLPDNQPKNVIDQF
jgi:hypothetical protein